MLFLLFLLLVLPRPLARVRVLIRLPSVRVLGLVLVESGGLSGDVDGVTGVSGGNGEGGGVTCGDGVTDAGVEGGVVTCGDGVTDAGVEGGGVTCGDGVTDAGVEVVVEGVGGVGVSDSVIMSSSRAVRQSRNNLYKCMLEDKGTSASFPQSEISSVLVEVN